MDVDSRDSNPQSTLEEEAKKSNTDCVYFLASPLTCIKGADCEYRHSENARMNPRDCWFWLNGNCLNPKCAFRHPPLDGCRGLPGSNSSGGTFQPSLPPAVAPAPPHYASTPFHPQSYASNRQKVPCYYFQMGSCLKGDKCQFMHGPQPPNESALPQIAKVNPISDPQATKTFANGSEDPRLTQKNLWQKKSEVESTAQALKAVKGDTRSGFLRPIGNTVKAPTNVDIELAGPMYAAPMAHALSSSPLHSQEHDEQPQNDKEVDESLGESPPGFDVLVSDGEEEEEYFDPDSEIAPGHGGMHLSSTREFDRMGSYTVDEFEGEEGEAYNAYAHTQERIGWDQHHAPRERLPERTSMNKRRLMLQEESPDRRGGQDLCHSLSKRIRPSGSGGILSSNRHADSKRDDRLREDWHHRRSSRERLQRPNTESSVSNRLRGRIRFPGRPSPDTSFHRYPDAAESERRRMRGRSSPIRPGIKQGRHHERATGRENEDDKFQLKRSKVQNVGSEERKADSLDFAGPKSLAELKSAKVSHTHEQNSAFANRQALKSQVSPRGGGTSIGKCTNQDSSVLSFEGPKPLSDILKRKRGMGSGENTDSEKETEGNAHTDVGDSHSRVLLSTELKKDLNEAMHSPVHGQTTNQEFDSAVEVHPFQSNGSPARASYNVEEDALMLDPENPSMEDRESEEVGIEGENQDQDVEEEYLDDEDGDDFARKLGVMFT